MQIMDIGVGRKKRRIYDQPFYLSNLSRARDSLKPPLDCGGYRNLGGWNL